MVGKIHVLDELTVEPERLDEVRRLMTEGYMAGAKARGMTLEQTWLTPPIELFDQPNTLMYLWSVPDAAAWWVMRGAAGRDPGVSEFWAEVDALCVERQRRFLVDDQNGEEEE